MALTMSLLSGVLIGTLAERSATCLDNGALSNTLLGAVGGLAGGVVLLWMGLDGASLPVASGDGIPITQIAVLGLAGALGAWLVLALCCLCRRQAPK